jgi:hypothetical protein
VIAAGALTDSANATLCLTPSRISAAFECTGIHDPAKCSQKAEALHGQGVKTFGMVVNCPHETCCTPVGIQRWVGVADCKAAADGLFKLTGVPDP